MVDIFGVFRKINVRQVNIAPENQNPKVQPSSEFRAVARPEILLGRVSLRT